MHRRIERVPDLEARGGARARGGGRALSGSVRAHLPGAHVDTGPPSVQCRADRFRPGSGSTVTVVTLLVDWPHGELARTAYELLRVRPVNVSDGPEPTVPSGLLVSNQSIETGALLFATATAVSVADPPYLTWASAGCVTNCGAAQTDTHAAAM